MTQRTTRALIVTRPAIGTYEPDVLRLEERALPELGDGDLHLEVLYLSLDPTNRNWLKLEEANTLRSKIGRDLHVGDAMVGEILGRVIESRDPAYVPGDIVAGVGEWQEETVVPAARMRPVPKGGGELLATHLTIFSHIGLAAASGLHEIAKIQPGETVLVSAAGGATGRLAVGIAAAHGCTVIAIAGGPEKCAEAIASGATAAIDYKAEADLTSAIRAAAPNGVDVYFDNVGGPTLDAALMSMAQGGRVAVCGVLSDYDAGEDRVGVKNMFQVLIREIRIQGFLAQRYWEKRHVYYDELRGLLESGRIKHIADESVGLETAPQQLATLFKGANKGKLIVRIGAQADERL